MRAPDRQSAEEESEHFVEEYKARYPKATECLVKDQKTMLTIFDFPAEHWLHSLALSATSSSRRDWGTSVCTTNPIESSFATVKVRTRKTKGAGSRKAGLAMAFKLVLAAEMRWRNVYAPHLVALVHAGVEFKDGEQVLHYYQVAPIVLEQVPVQAAA